MYWYLKNVHNEKISRNNLYEILQNFAEFRERKYNKISQNFAKFHQIRNTFVVILYFAK
jgi:hypothetical protein